MSINTLVWLLLAWTCIVALIVVLAFMAGKK